MSFHGIKKILLWLLGGMVLGGGSVFAQSSPDIILLEYNDTDELIIEDSENTPTLFFGEGLEYFLKFDKENDFFLFSDTVSFQNNEVHDFRLENLSSAPECTLDSAGRAYYNTTDLYSYLCDGVEWNILDNDQESSPIALPYLYQITPRKLSVAVPTLLRIQGENFSPNTQFHFTPEVSLDSIKILDGNTAEITVSSAISQQVSITASSLDQQWVGNTLTIAFQDYLDVAQIQQQFREQAMNISTWVPYLYPIRFDDTLTGNKIIDGGNDMYDTGNILSTNLTSALAYTDGEIIQDKNIWGEGGEYFTDVSNNIFFLSARVGEGVETFSIKGNLGADNRGSTEGGTLEYGGYTAYFKKVYGAGSDPSVNHMIIVNTTEPLTHAFPESTDNDFDSLSGLSVLQESENPRLFYLLFASKNGGYIDNTQMENILIYTVDTILQ